MALGGEADLSEPEVEILSLKEIEENDYEAELWISSSEDNPLVTFFIDDAGRLQVMAVEY